MNGGETFVRLESWLDERLAQAQADFYFEQDRRLLSEIKAREAAEDAEESA